MISTSQQYWLRCYKKIQFIETNIPYSVLELEHIDVFISGSVLTAE